MDTKPPKNDKSSPTASAAAAAVTVMDKYIRLQQQQDDRSRPDTQYKDVSLSANLLDRFVQGECLNQVVLTLYPGDQGYTLTLRIQNSLENETSKIPYEEDELLKCIDNQQLPPVLVELLEEAGAQVFYNGCVFVEVRDLRDSSSKQSWNVLLKPSPQTILADAQQICQEHGWGAEELLQLESTLCMAMAEPLCLNPNPSLGELATNRDRSSKQMLSQPLRQSRRTWCESRKRKQAEIAQNSGHFKLHDFLKRKSLLGRGIPPILQPSSQEGTSSSISSSSSSQQQPNQLPVQLDVSDVLRLAKPLERPKETVDCSLIPFEEYLYETDRINNRVYLVRLTILQRPATEEFLGQLYVDRDFRDGKFTGGASCMFSLGSRLHVNRYIQQFTEIFTEEGRKSVKITHQVQGHMPRVMYTQSMREKERLKEKEEQQQQQQQPQPAAASVGGVQPIPPNKEPPDNPIPSAASASVKAEHQVSGTITKTALLESLKSGTVNPAIANIVSSLLSSTQQQQQQQLQQPQPHPQQQPQQMIRPVGTVAALNANAILVNGHHHPQLQQQQQSLLRNATVVRPPVVATAVASAPGQPNVQLVTQSFSLQQPQPQLRPNNNAAAQATSLAALLTTSKVASLQPNISPGKGKLLPVVGDHVVVAGPHGPSTANGNSITGSLIRGQIIRQASVNSGGNNTVPTPILPSYSQAISQTGVTGTTTVVRAIRPAIAGAGRRPPEVVALNGSAGGKRFSMTVPALSALLAGTPSADSPGANSAAASQNLPSLLERLQQQQQSSPNKPVATTTTTTTNALNNNNHQHLLHALKPGSNNNINVQSINLAGVQGAVANLPTLQSIQVSIPGLAVPISLSLTTSSGSTPSTVSTANANAGGGVMGNVRLASAAPGQPISIPLSVLQIPNAGGGAPMQLLSSNSVPVKEAPVHPPFKITSNNSQQLSSSGQSSGSLLAQQQLQLALQRQVQVQLQQKMAAKQKSKPPNS